MKEDRVFNDLFQRIVYSGSYYKGTKFGKPDEFDLVFLFKLPIDQTKVKVRVNKIFKINLLGEKIFKFILIFRLTRTMEIMVL